MTYLRLVTLPTIKRSRIGQADRPLLITLRSKIPSGKSPPPGVLFPLLPPPSSLSNRGGRNHISRGRTRDATMNDVTMKKRTGGGVKGAQTAMDAKPRWTQTAMDGDGSSAPGAMDASRREACLKDCEQERFRTCDATGCGVESAQTAMNGDDPCSPSATGAMDPREACLKYYKEQVRFRKRAAWDPLPNEATRQTARAVIRVLTLADVRRSLAIFCCKSSRGTQTSARKRQRLRRRRTKASWQSIRSAIRGLR